MALCESCLPPADCEHEYCDSCTKCHSCGVYASAPAAPVNPGGVKPYRNPEWVTPRKRIVPAFDEVDYMRFSYSTNQAFQQLH